MKQFNLDEYLKNPSRKVVTRDGRPVRIICTDAKGICPVVGLVAYENYELAFNVTKDGRIDGVLDLFFAAEKHEGWINLYKPAYTGAEIYNTSDLAREYGTCYPNYVTTIKIEWEE